MRTFDDIIPPSRRSQEPAGQGPITPREPIQLPPPARFPIVPLAIILLIIAASAGALFYFSTAKVTITPSSVSAAIQNSFTATKSSGELPFEVITAQKIATQGVKGSGTKNVTTSASGKITIYNTQSVAQKLVANTRFATGAGLIFRIREPVTIPSGTASNPGSVQVTVYADQPGSTYNIAPTSFTIPGFAGTPQAMSVSARSTVAMTGGASGEVPVVDSAIEAQAKSALKTALAPDLAQAIEAQIPPGYVLLPGASSVSYEDLPPKPSSATGMVEIHQQGTVTAIVFPNSALAKQLAHSVSGLSYQGEPLTLESPGSLTLTPTSGDIDPGATSFSFVVSGTAGFVYTVDSARIAAAISGKTRSAAEVALTNYPEVKTASIVLRPFWRTSFPQDPSSISVVVTSPTH